MSAGCVRVAFGPIALLVIAEPVSPNIQRMIISPSVSASYWPLPSTSRRFGGNTAMLVDALAGRYCALPANEAVAVKIPDVGALNVHVATPPPSVGASHACAPSEKW